MICQGYFNKAVLKKTVTKAKGEGKAEKERDEQKNLRNYQH